MAATDQELTRIRDRLHKLESFTTSLEAKIGVIIILQALHSKLIWLATLGLFGVMAAIIAAYISRYGVLPP